MAYLENKPMPIRTTAEEIFAMEHTHRLTRDMEAQDLGLIAYLDLINYQNGHSFDPPLMTRNAMFWMALCLPPTAYIDPKKTREALYYIYSAHNNIAKPYLSDSAHAMESQHMALIEKGMTAVLYRLVSGRNDLDPHLRAYAPQILEVFQKNAYLQKAWGIDTVIGKFEPMPTLMALMVLEIYDKIFGTCLCAIKDDVLAFVREKLIDPSTRLFVRSYNTGYMGYPGEITSPGVTWQADAPFAGGCGLALPLFHYFCPQEAETMWDIYRSKFIDGVLETTAQDIADSMGASFVTQLGEASEDLLGALLAAKNFGDQETFQRLQSHIYEIGDPNMWEGQVHYTQFGPYAHFIGSFIHLARVHIPWKTLIDHTWERFYHWDFFTDPASLNDHS